MKRQRNTTFSLRIDWTVAGATPNAGQGGDRHICVKWRRDGDSNPGGAFTPTRFPGVRLKPLGHPSRGPAWWKHTPGLNAAQPSRCPPIDQQVARADPVEISGNGEAVKTGVWNIYLYAGFLKVSGMNDSVSLLAGM